MKQIILIGAGGHAAEVVDYINYNNRVFPEKTIEILGFLDINKEAYNHYEFEKPFLGTAEEHTILKNVEYLFCFGNLKYKKELVEKFTEGGALFLTFIHPTALISPSAKIGKGVLISHNASVGPKVVIGDFNILNSRCTIGHDSQIGDYNFISPQVSVSGNTKIGNSNMFGVNSATIPGVKIGNTNTIGAGSIITKNIADYSLVVGVPGKVILVKDPSDL